jgi:hypothetical protein
MYIVDPEKKKDIYQNFLKNLEEILGYGQKKNRQGIHISIKTRGDKLSSSQPR